MTIRLTTLGGLRAVADDVELDGLLRPPVRAALFVYLAVERRASRASLTALLWPDRDEEQARHALRQSLYQLRKDLGPGWIESRGHELRVSPHVRTDVHAFVEALERRDAEAAARLYHGPFLDGVHLVDLKSWEGWVDGRRAGYARGFRKACREWLEERRAAGDPGGAVEAAHRWVAADPLEDEAQHRLIEALAAAGERVEAIRQYETYARLLELEGLRPLDETVALLERVRSEAATWPEPTAAAEPGSPSDAEAFAVAPSSAAPRAHRGRLLRRGRLAPVGLGGLVVALGALWLVHARWVAGPPEPTLVAGAAERGERIVLADFGSPRTDPALGAVVTDALRIDLLETAALRALDPSEVREILARMHVEGDVPLTGELAREVALRGGVKAVLEGEIARAGTGYVLTAALRSADSDRILTAFRETARSADDVIPAIDRLSRGIRRRAGPTLRAVDAAPPPERVTTSSLEALRVYGEALRALQDHDRRRAVNLLEEAVELDPQFGMAWRALGMSLGERDAVRRLEAVTRAWELRQRLTPRERHLAVAAYHREVVPDHGATVEAYRRVLEIAPDDPTALNNLALAHRWVGDYDEASELLQRAVDRPDASVTAYLNLVYTRLAQGRPEEAREAADALARRHPGEPAAAGARFWIHFLRGDEAAARAEMEALLSKDVGLSPTERAWTHEHVALLALWRGRLSEARDHMVAAERIARDGGSALDGLGPRLRRAYIEAAVSDPDRAVDLLRRGLEDVPLDEVSPPERAHHLRATVFALAGRVDEVEAVLQAFESEVPSALHAAYRTRGESVRALLRLQRGDAEEAVRILDGVRASHPCRYCLAKRMGRALAEAGRLREAAEEWEAALAWKDELFHGVPMQVPQNLWILQRLPLLYEELGDTVRALDHHRRLVELWSDADPEVQPRVDHARARIAALEAGRR